MCRLSKDPDYRKDDIAYRDEMLSAAREFLDAAYNQGAKWSWGHSEFSRCKFTEKIKAFVEGQEKEVKQP